MPEIPVPFGPDTDPARSTYVNDSRLVNAFAEPTKGGKVPYAVYASPGLESFVTLTEGAVRGIFVLGSILYVVANENLYRVNSAGATTQITGSIIGTRSVITAINRKSPNKQVAIVSDNKVYILENDVLTEITDPDLPANVNSVAYIDGYFIFFLDDGRFFVTAINEGSSVSSLDFAEAEGNPDGGVRVLVVGREVWLYGKETVEVWVDNGAPTGAPFERLGGGMIMRGCKSKYTPAVFDNGVVWVADNGLVVRAEGYVPKRVSNHGVEKDIQDTIDDQRAEEIEAFVYFEGGHEFYQLTSPTWSWTFDAATQLWHRRESYGLTRSKIRHYARAWDKHIVGDATTGKLWHMGMDFFNEGSASEFLITTIRSPVIHMSPSRLCFNRLHVDVEMGIGVLGGDTTTLNPKMMLRWSDDGGKTFSSEREAALGPIGSYGRRCTFNRLGMCGNHGRTFELRMSAPVKRAFIKATAEVDPLAA